MELSTQHIIILGGTSGVGLSTASMLAQAGAQVTIASRRAEKVEQALAHLRQYGNNVTGAAVDATSLSDLRAFFQRCGAFDHLVLTLSGGEGSGMFRTLDLTRLRHGFDAKFWAQIQAAQASLETLRPDGSLTFVTAASARAALPGTGGLAAINGALEAMIRPLAVELQPLRVNAVSPGVIATPWWDRIPEQQRKAFFHTAGTNLPVKRVGQPEDVAQAIVFLLQNTFVTGSIIECDGGVRLTPGG